MLLASRLSVKMLENAAAAGPSSSAEQQEPGSGIQITPVCVAFVMAVGFLVAFFGYWAALEAHDAI